jgi:hypothetical protein
MYAAGILINFAPQSQANLSKILFAGKQIFPSALAYERQNHLGQNN